MRSIIAQPVVIPAGAAALNGDLRLPPSARGVVIFAHGSGSSRFSRRNRQVAEFLDGHGRPPRDTTVRIASGRSAAAINAAAAPVRGGADPRAEPIDVESELPRLIVDLFLLGREEVEQSGRAARGGLVHPLPPPRRTRVGDA